MVPKKPPFPSGFGATTGPSVAVHGPAGVGAVATPIAGSPPGLAAVSVTVKYMTYRSPKYRMSGAQKNETGAVQAGFAGRARPPSGPRARQPPPRRRVFL